MNTIQLARKIADEYLKRKKEFRYLLLYTISRVVDENLKKKLKWKKKEELFPSLYDYSRLVPNTMWIPAEKLDSSLCRGLGGKFLVVENPYYKKK